MTGARSFILSAAAVFLLVAAAGCASRVQPPTAAPASHSSLAPTVGSSAASSKAPTSKSGLAAEAASTTMRRYFATVDRLGQDRSLPLRGLAKVATSIQLSAQRNLLTQQRAEHQRQTGDTKIALLQVQSVNLDNSGPAQGKVPTVTIDVCWDVSNVDVVDRSGTSVVSASRPNTGWTRYTVANYRWANHPGDGWRVASGQDLKKSPCAAS